MQRVLHMTLLPIRQSFEIRAIAEDLLQSVRSQQEGAS